MKEEMCFACNRKTKRKRRSRHWEKLSRVRRDDGSATLIDDMKKNEHLSDQWLRSATKKYLHSLLKKNLKFSLKERFSYKKNC